MEWEHSAIRDAAAYLRELIDAGASDARTVSVYHGLLDVIDPVRYASRVQRVLAADAAVALGRAGCDRRSDVPRRCKCERRGEAAADFGADRRSGNERRSGRDRRHA